MSRSTLDYPRSQLQVPYRSCENPFSQLNIGQRRSRDLRASSVEMGISTQQGCAPLGGSQRSGLDLDAPMYELTRRAEPLDFGAAEPCPIATPFIVLGVRELSHAQGRDDADHRRGNTDDSDEEA